MKQVVRPMLRTVLLTLLLSTITLVPVWASEFAVMKTNLGTIKIELDREHAPVSVVNFEHYVKQGFYNGTIFHRVIPGFVIQGGGFDQQLQRKETGSPIKNEADNGLRNERGTIAMARTPVVNSATSQFFINLKNNPSLNHRGKSPGEYGYAVFGRVVEGMDVVDRIAAQPTSRNGQMQNVPVQPIVIESVELTNEETPAAEPVTPAPQ